MSLASKIAAAFNGSSLNPAVVPRLSGSVVQVQHVKNSALGNSVTVMPFDDTIPQITEGAEIMTLAITPTNAANYLLIEVTLYCGNNTGVANCATLFQDSTANALAAAAQSQYGVASAIAPMTFQHRMLAGTISSTTFRLRAGPSSAVTMTINGVAGGRIFGGVYASSITITELTA